MNIKCFGVVVVVVVVFFKANSLKPHSVGRVSSPHPLSGAITSPDVNEYFQH